MPRTTAERRLNSIVKNLDAEDKRQVLDLAERLAEGGTAKSSDVTAVGGGWDEEKNGTPSYVEAAGDNPAHY